MIDKRLLLAVAALAIGAAPASAVTLSNGDGDGSVTVGVDGFGAFGSSVGGDGTSDAVYNPVGAIGAAGTTFQSAIAVSFGGVRPYLTTGVIDGAPAPASDLQILSQTATSVTSSFVLGELGFRLVQSLSEASENGVRTGTVLNQVYTIRNLAEVTNGFEVVRYIDGDLQFDGSIDDGGGRIVQGGSDVLFETDAASAGDASTTFLGITATPGDASPNNRFEVSSFAGLRGRVEIADNLSNGIQGDTDGDGFIDQAYDVTMALRSQFSLAAGEAVTYTTQTLFGNAVPPSPGSTEALPLLPDDIDVSGSFVFNVSQDDFAEGEIFFIDPVIAIGYTYEITGADFDKVQAPSFAAVPDPDGFLLSYLLGGDEFTVALAAGEIFTFGVGVTSFRIEGIDESLALDPANASAFVTGVAYKNATAFVVQITQTPITFDTDVAPIPLPAAGWLLLSGFAGLAALRRRR